MLPDHQVTQALSSDVMQFVLHKATEGVVVCDVTGRIRYMNETASRFIQGEVTFIYQFLKDFSALNQRFEAIPAESLFLRIIANEHVALDVLYRNPHIGEVNVFQISGQPLTNQQGMVEGVVVYLVDKTAAKYAEKWLEGQSRILEQIARGESTITILEYLVSSFQAQHPRAVCSMFTFHNSTRQFKHTAGNLPYQFVERILRGQNDFLDIRRGTTQWNQQIILCDSIPFLRNYHEYALKLGYQTTWIKNVFTMSGAFAGFFVISHPHETQPTSLDERTLDTYAYISGVLITKENDVETIKFLTYNDRLTGLPNRSYLLERLTEFIDHSKRTKMMLGLLVIDIDRFKAINNSVGHAVGDSVLRVLADRIKICMSPSDIIARIGGDEFAILVPQLRSQEWLSSITNVILGLLREEVVVEGHSFRLTASVGASVFPMDGWDAQTILKNAETAMYRAKHRGYNKFELYSMDMNERLYDTLLLESDLHKALEQGEFYVEYQPRVNVKTGEITSAEALIRWAHPTRGLISPAEFISLAEDNGLIIPIGFWVIETVCKQLHQWDRKGLRQIPIAVNVSTKQFEHPDFLIGFQRCIERHNTVPTRIEIEITESLLMNQSEENLTKLQSLQQLGTSISIDDFGVGYSSLGLLKRLSLNSLKIDKSFIQDMLGNDNSAAIVSAIIQLGHILGLDVIAEGVETVEQLKFLQEHHCDMVQGFLFCKPLSASDFQPHLSQNYHFPVGTVFQPVN